MIVQRRKLQLMIFSPMCCPKATLLIVYGVLRSERGGASHQASEAAYLNRDSFFIYGPMVRTTLLSGRVLFEDSWSWCVTISSYLGTVVSSAAYPRSVLVRFLCEPTNQTSIG